MKKFIASLLCVAALVWAVDAGARFPRGTPAIGVVNMGGGSNMLERSVFASSTPTLPYSQWYVPGNGSPAISTSDYLLTNGVYWSPAYDLDAMGATGATIKAREGFRYAWLICSDHVGDFAGSADLFVGYSNDPQILPEPTTMRSLLTYPTSISVVDQNGTTQSNLTPYQIPHMEYNPDPGAFGALYIYMEAQNTSNGFQHELTLIYSADLLTATIKGPSIPTTNVNGWSSYGKPKRLGVNSWEVYSFGKPDATGTPLPATYKYTSTDGWVWTSTYTPQAFYVNPVVTISGQDWMIAKEAGSTNDYLSLFSVNSSRQYTGTTTRISTGFGPSLASNGAFGAPSVYPGPTYLQDLDVYSEDGITTIYVSRGFPTSNHDATNTGPFLNNYPSTYDIGASITSNVLTVTSVPGSMPPLAAPFRVQQATNKAAITAQLTGTGGASCPDPTCNGTTGTYSMAATSNVGAGTLTVFTNGGLWQQFIDIYYLTTDPTAAASAAPLGVKASCAAGVATVQWNNSLPHQNYRVYKGTSAGTQATLVGNVTGTSTTDTPTANAQTWYKVVTMNVTEQKSRVVNVYCSVQNAQVNKHVNRVLNDGGSGFDITFLATADQWLNSNNTYRYLNWWTDVRFGYKLDGSGFIAKIYDLGTTLLPRGGDYTPTTSNTFPSTSSNTSYSATSFRGTTPSWVNNAANAHGYYGNGRTNNVQRWNEITLLAAYQKPGTASLGLFGYGEFDGMYLQHASGSSGNINFAMSAAMGGANPFTTATVPFSTATAAHVAAGVLDSSGNMTAYLDGTPGTPVPTAFANPTLANNSVLRGMMPADSSNIPVLASGSTTGGRKPGYYMSNEALATFGATAAFSKGFSQSLVQSWGAQYN